jgi:predicted dienelactone hydrolase
VQNRITIILASLILCCGLSAQEIGHTTVTFVDSSRSNRQIATEIYYPATSAGTNTPIATGVFPLITFGHGFVMVWSAYQNFWELLVPEGYILAFPKTESGFSPSHAEFGTDLKFLITKIQSSGAGPFVPSTSVGATSAIMGHSMGGGSAFLAAENNAAIRTMVSFAAANTNPSSIAASQQVSVPTLLFSGVNDCVTPPAQHQDIMYDSTAAEYKTQVYITGGGHCYFANSNFNCTFGESTCSPSPTITRAEQQSATHDFLKLWLAYFLKDDCQKAQEFQDSLSLSSRISYRQSKSIECFTGINDHHLLPDSFSVFPNPFSNLLTLEMHHENIRSVNLYNAVMQNAGEYLFAETDRKLTVDFSSLANGIYFIKINDRYWKKILKCGPEY